MTSTLPASVDRSRIRQLIIEAERVIREIERLPEFATDAEGRSWAEFTAEGARRAWANLLSVSRRGDAPYFTTRIRTVIAFGVPLAEAPPALKARAADVRVFTTALAEDYFDVIPPLLGDNRALRADAIARLEVLLPELATEFGT